MNHCDFSVTCPNCGHSLCVVNQSNPTSTEATMVVWCPDCRAEFGLLVRLVAQPGRTNGRAVRPPMHRRAVECETAARTP
jgi:hypothetical protein